MSKNAENCSMHYVSKWDLKTMILMKWIHAMYAWLNIMKFKLSFSQESL